jgi:hypothetical protein
VMAAAYATLYRSSTRFEEAAREPVPHA